MAVLFLLSQILLVARGTLFCRCFAYRYLDAIGRSEKKQIKQDRKNGIEPPADHLAEINAFHLKQRNQCKRCDDPCKTSDDRDSKDGIDSAEASHIGMQNVSDKLHVNHRQIESCIEKCVAVGLCAVLAWEKERDDRCRKAR